MELKLKDLEIVSLHHYYFWLYALNQALDLQPGLNREQLLNAIAEYVTAQARLVGVYER